MCFRIASEKKQEKTTTTFRSASDLEMCDSNRIAHRGCIARFGPLSTWGFEEGLLKDKFAFFEAAKRALFKTPFQLDQVSFSTPELIGSYFRSLVRGPNAQNPDISAPKRNINPPPPCLSAPRHRIRNR